MGDWQKTKISQFLFERTGKYQPGDKTIAELKRIDKIDFSGNFHISQKSSNTKMILIKPGDFVISGIGVHNGSMGVYEGENDVTATIHYSSYTIDAEKISIEYFKRFLKSTEFLRLINDQVRGGMRPEIKAKHLLPLRIDLPDIEQQEKFVSYFRSIETEHGELKKETARRQALVKKIRQQILREAMEGKLTAKWREQNPNVEPANELLKRIQVEKEWLIKDKKKQRLLPTDGKDKKSFNRPATWIFTSLANCSINKDEFRAPVTRADRDGREKIYDYYGASGVIDKIDGFTHEGKHLLIGEDGANLVARSTSIAFIADGKFWVNNHAHAIETIDQITLDYLEIHINGIDLKPYITGGFQPKLSQAKLNSIPIALPPLPEQQAIVSKVEKLLALCEQMEEQITTNQTHTEQLMRAVLREAFSQRNAGEPKWSSHSLKNVSA